MSDLIGYKGNAKNLAVRVENYLMGTKYWGFRIQGERRSGRSSFFTEVSEHLNVSETLPINCFVGELVHATPEGFEQTLMESINTSNSCSHDYSSHIGKVQESEGFFVLCSDLYKKEGKVPVFLIDMGKAMEEQYNSDRGLDGVIDLSRLLRKIYNLLEERNISLILGIGLTTKFVEDSGKYIADVFQRYGAFVILTNTSFEGEAPCEDFQQIVQTISGLEIPDRYKCLWRGHTVTAGQLGENLKDSETNEITSQSLWQNLRGKWDILGNIQLEEIPPNELGELILADETIEEELYPEYLEPCDGGYRANDLLYETFKFVSPWRDPSTTERIKSRVDDPDDNKVVGEILSSIGKSMDQLGFSEIHEPDILGQKSGLMEVKVNKHTSPDLNALENELFKTAFPRKLITVLCLTANPAEEMLIKRLKEYAEKDCFILILCLEGVVNLFRMQLGRHIKENIKSAKIETVSLEEITSILSNQDEVLLEEVNNWVSDAISVLFSNKPVLCVGHQTIKQLISGTISSGELPIDSFAQQIGISKTDANKCLKFLVKPQILTKRQSIAIWEPHNDVILRILLEYSGNEDKICEEVKNLYTTDEVKIEDLVSLYQCIPGGNDLVDFTKDRILAHSRAEQDHQLSVIGKYLEGERKLNPLYELKYKEYRERQLCEIEDITPYRTDIIKLLEDIKSAIDEIKGKRDRDRQELSKRIEALRQKLENHSKYFSDEKKNELLRTIEGIRSLKSPAFNRVELEINKQKNRVESLEKDIKKLTERLDQLQEYSDKTEYRESKDGLEQIESLVLQLSLDDAEDQIKDVDAQIIKLEELKERQNILDDSPVRESHTITDPDGPPDDDPDDDPDGPPDDDPDDDPDGPPDDDPDDDPDGPPDDDLEKEKKFDLSNFEERKDLAKTLLRHKEKINKIDVQVDL